jgi:hypothetical protein
MSVDELKAGFARLAEPVVPVEDPYGRLLRRARRSRRLRLTGWGSGLAAGLVAALLVPLLGPVTAGPTPGPTSGPNDDRGVAITGWVQRLIDGRTRGNLALDGTFLDTVTQRVEPVDFGLSPELSHRTVLFAGDAGTYRAVLLAFTSDSRQMGVWLVGDAGTSALQLARAGRTLKASGAAYDDKVKVLPAELAPFAATGVSDAGTGRYLSIGLAPPGCTVATRDDGSTRWRDSPDGDYVLRTDAVAQSMSTFAKVSCDGVVRYQASLLNNARIELTPAIPTDAQLDAALAGARGTPPDRTDARRAVIGVGQVSGSIAGCKVRYSGPVPGAVDSSPMPGGGVLREPPVLVTTCPGVGSLTYFGVDTHDGGGTGGGTSVKPDDPAAILVVRDVVVQEKASSGGGTDSSTRAGTRVLVLAPRTATQLRVLPSGPTVPLADGVGSLVVPDGGTVQVRALDATGAVVGTGSAPSAAAFSDAGTAPETVDNWS